MVGYARRSDVGAVGAKLLYEDDTVQHAGVIVGVEGVAFHQFWNTQSMIQAIWDELHFHRIFLQ